MRHIRAYAPLVLCVTAAAAAMVLAGPDSLAFLATVLLGFVTLHVHGALRAARLEEKLDDATATFGRLRHRATPQATVEPPRRSTVEPPRRKPSSPGRSSAGPGRGEGAAGRNGNTEGGRRGSGTSPGRRAPGPTEPEEPVASDVASSDEELDWLQDQLAGDVEEVSFLPPYATDVPEAEVADADDFGEEVEAFLETEAPFVPPTAAPEEVAGEASSGSREVPIPRHFALGTVAIIRRILEPSEVAEILLEQRRQPKQRFGELAVALGFLTQQQLEELLRSQQEGLFTDEEIREARHRLREFRESGAMDTEST